MTMIIMNIIIIISIIITSNSNLISSSCRCASARGDLLAQQCIASSPCARSQRTSSHSSHPNPTCVLLLVCVFVNVDIPPPHPAYRCAITRAKVEVWSNVNGHKAFFAVRVAYFHSGRVECETLGGSNPRCLIYIYIYIHIIYIYIYVYIW